MKSPQMLRTLALTVLNCVSTNEDGWYLRNDNPGMGLMEPYELATAYLDEHQADDDEPVTEDWLRSVGGEAVCPPGPYYHQDEWDVVFSKGGDFLLYISHRPDWPTAKARIGKDQPDLLIGDVATMGEFRRLCRALGIVLSETVPSL